MNTKKTILIFATIAVLFSGTTVFAQGENPAEKVIQGVKDTVGALIDAKDKNDPKEPEIKIETYKKVLDLALTDAKDMKLKLLSYDVSEKPTGTIALWQKDRLSDINNAIKRYEKEQTAVNVENISGDDVKALAESLKKWREETYTPLTDEIQAFILINQQRKSLDTAESRLEKVRGDVAKLKKAKFKKIKTVEERFQKASDLIATAGTQFDTAEKLFTKNYLLDYMSDTDSQKIALVKEIKEEKTNKEKKVDSVAPSTSPSQPVSIKDLIDTSFARVKDAYQVFIEMSNLVK
jgi:hypothetical protein